MRDILFRGKRLDNGEWVYGSLLQVEHEDGSFTTAIFHKKDAGGDAEVSPSTIGQYTGLKDKNGKKIFEGDIVKLKDYHHERIVYVFWGNIGSWFYGGDGYSDEYIFNSSEKEVIGNIHDKHEPLEGGEQNGKNHICKRP